MKKNKEGDVRKAVYSGIMSGNVEGVRILLEDNPAVRNDQSVGGRWLHLAAKTGRLEMAEMMLALGLNVNECCLPEHATPLIAAVEACQVPMVGFLLSHGADPNSGRPIICAINADSEELGLTLVKLLVDHGIDLSRSYAWFGDKSKSYSALQWAELNERHKIVEYLRGCQNSAAMNGIAAEAGVESDVIAYFAAEFGPVSPRTLKEIVPTGQPSIDIHAIAASPERNHVTLFTTGMSTRPMNVPPDQDRYRFAELFVQLPADWKYRSLRDPTAAWPLHWLRSCAQYPHAHNTWLGGPATIIANDDPPKPLGPGTRFTSILLIAEKTVNSRDGHGIQLYRMVPLYTEERALETKHGIAALMRAFDKASTPFVVDVRRRNVATGK